MLEHGWKQLRRQTIHSINRPRSDLDESDQHSEFPCVGHIGRRFGGQPFYWWREFEHWSDLVCSLDKRKERGSSSDVWPKHGCEPWGPHRFQRANQSGRVSGTGFSRRRSLGHEHERQCLYAREYLSLIHISEPTRLLSISYAVFCLK